MTLKIRNLGLSIGGKEILKSVNLDIAQGQVLALVGESGSGKSMTAAAIGRLLPPHTKLTGSIEVMGENILEFSDQQMRTIRRDRLGYIFQEPMTALNPLHRVRKQIKERLDLRPDIERSVEACLDEVGLGGNPRILESYPYALSGGQRQRVLMAIALATSPNLLIADEPTTALDAIVEAELLDQLRLLRARGQSILFITHDLRLLPGFADNVAIMHQGVVVEAGPLAQILKTPTHPLTQSLLQAEHPKKRAPIASKDVLLEAKNLSVTYGKPRGFLRRSNEFCALHETDLALAQGETLALIGGSGSGKSTLAHALVDLVPRKGTIHILGQKTLDRAARRHVQVVFQDPYGSLSPRMSIKEIIGEGLHVHHITDDIEQAVIDVMLEVGLDPKRRHAYPHEFSGGQRQRIAIARALVLRPKILILDEPTSALDRTVQSQIITLLIDLQEKYDLSYLFISHDIRTVEAIAHRVMVMHQGRVIESGPVQDIVSNPQNETTRALISAALCEVPRVEAR